MNRESDAQAATPSVLRYAASALEGGKALARSATRKAKQQSAPGATARSISRSAARWPRASPEPLPISTTEAAAGLPVLSGRRRDQLRDGAARGRRRPGGAPPTARVTRSRARRDAAPERERKRCARAEPPPAGLPRQAGSHESIQSNRMQAPAASAVSAIVRR
jgi:hypothetical protein